MIQVNLECINWFWHPPSMTYNYCSTKPYPFLWNASKKFIILYNKSILSLLFLRKKAVFKKLKNTREVFIRHFIASTHVYFLVQFRLGFSKCSEKHHRNSCLKLAQKCADVKCSISGCDWWFFFLYRHHLLHLCCFLSYHSKVLEFCRLCSTFPMFGK